VLGLAFEQRQMSVYKKKVNTRFIFWRHKKFNIMNWLCACYATLPSTNHDFFYFR